MEGFSDPLANHGSWEHELDGGAVRWSGGLYRIHGVTPDAFETTVDSIRGLVHPDDLEPYRASVSAAIEARAPFAVQHRIIRPGGEVRTVMVRGCFLAGEEERPDRLVGTTQDVTGREGEDEQLWHLANHDSLSGLFNRRRFMEELERELAFSKRTGEPGAVLMLDLDRFKDINDSLGHMAGDTLLTKVAARLRKRLRATDTLARLGGDEFAVVLPACPPSAARRIAEELVDDLIHGASVQIAGLERQITASIGIAPFGPGPERTADEMLVEADLAMYRAKATERGGVEVFDEEMRAELAARLTLEAELRLALERGELSVLYQPLVALSDGTTVGCEALLRWEHPRRGQVPPSEFISVAEECGLIAELGGWILDRACAQAGEWRRAGHNLYVSVNVSPIQLMRDDIVSRVAGALEEARLPAPLLCLEVTETSLVHDHSPAVESLRALKELGVRIAIDDFGGGASSFGLLRMLPIDQIKIDRLFVEGIDRRADDRAIVAAVLSLAEELGLSVLAEGVETERQQGELRTLGCGFAQGYLYSPARPASELALSGYSATVQPGVGDPSVIREFMRQIGIPARVGLG